MLRLVERKTLYAQSKSTAQAIETGEDDVAAREEAFAELGRRRDAGGVVTPDEWRAAQGIK